MRNGLVYSCTLYELRFLSAHKDLFAILAKTKPHLARTFGNRHVRLQVERDPDDGSEELFAAIMVNGKPERALDLLARFDHEYFIQASKRTRNRLTFTVDTP